MLVQFKVIFQVYNLRLGNNVKLIALQTLFNVHKVNVSFKARKMWLAEWEIKLLVRMNYIRNK